MADFRSTPLLAGIGLAITGALLQRVRPAVFDLPKPSKQAGDRPRFPRNAREVRDGIAAAAPDNMTDAVGRTLIFMGAALLAMRALDEIVDEDDRLF